MHTRTGFFLSFLAAVTFVGLPALAGPGAAAHQEGSPPVLPRPGAQERPLQRWIVQVQPDVQAAPAWRGVGREVVEPAVRRDRQEVQVPARGDHPGPRRTQPHLGAHRRSARHAPKGDPDQAGGAGPAQGQQAAKERPALGHGAAARHRPPGHPPAGQEQGVEQARLRARDRHREAALQHRRRQHVEEPHQHQRRGHYRPGDIVLDDVSPRDRIRYEATVPVRANSQGGRRFEGQELMVFKGEL